MIVEFAAADAGTGPLMWGQTAIWEVLRWLPAGDASLNIAMDCPVPAGRTLPEVAAAVRELLERHAALRTRYAGPSDDPHQVVVGNGRIDVAVHEMTTAANSAAEIARRLRDEAFDMMHNLPVRVAVLTERSLPSRVLLSFSHAAVDGWSAAIVRRDLADLLAADGPLPPRAQQPLQRAAYEQSAPAQRKSLKALEFWAAAVSELPPSMLEDLRQNGPAQLEWSRIDSPALAVATRRLAAATHATPSLVVRTAVAAVLGAWQKENDVALRLIVATRLRPETRDLVGAFNQNALFRLRLRPDESFRSLLRRAGTANLLAYQHCEYEPRALERVIADTAHGRGIKADGYCFFNDVRFDGSAPSAVPDADADADPVHLMSRTEPSVPTFDIEQKGSKFFFYLQDLTVTGRVMLSADRRFLGDRRAVDFLLELERLLVGASTAADSAPGNRPVSQHTADRLTTTGGTHET